jgi:hypothetical protein
MFNFTGNCEFRNCELLSVVRFRIITLNPELFDFLRDHQYSYLRDLLCAAGQYSVRHREPTGERGWQVQWMRAKVLKSVQREIIIHVFP